MQLNATTTNSLLQQRNSLQQQPTHCNNNQLTATTTQLTATTKQLTATHSRDDSALQLTATHCNTLQHAATRCNTLQHSRETLKQEVFFFFLQLTFTHYTTLKRLYKRRAILLSVSISMSIFVSVWLCVGAYMCRCLCVPVFQSQFLDK